MIAMIVLTWFLYRSRRKASIAQTGAGSKQSRSSTAHTAASTTKAKKSETDKARENNKKEEKHTTEDDTANDKQQQMLLEEMLELDKAYEAGQLEKVAYEKQRSKTKARLRSLIREQEATHK